MKRKVSIIHFLQCFLAFPALMPHIRIRGVSVFPTTDEKVRALNETRARREGTKSEPNGANGNAP